MKGVFLCSGGRVKTPTASKTKKKAVLSRDQCHALKKIVNVAGTTEQVLLQNASESLQKNPDLPLLERMQRYTVGVTFLKYCGRGTSSKTI